MLTTLGCPEIEGWSVSAQGFLSSELSRLRNSSTEEVLVVVTIYCAFMIFYGEFSESEKAILGALGEFEFRGILGAAREIQKLILGILNP